jgi:hypothetical protein
MGTAPGHGEGLRADLDRFLQRTQFSPHDQRIAYTIVGSSGHCIYVSAVTGGKPIRLSNDNYDQRSPTWSPDGAWIACKTLRDDGRSSQVRSGGGSRPAVLREGRLPLHPNWERKTGTGSPALPRMASPWSRTMDQQSRPLSKDDWPIFGWGADGSLLYGVKRLDTLHRTVSSINVDRSAAAGSGRRYQVVLASRPAESRLQPPAAVHPAISGCGKASSLRGGTSGPEICSGSQPCAVTRHQECT